MEPVFPLKYETTFDSPNSTQWKHRCLAISVTRHRDEGLQHFHKRLHKHNRILPPPPYPPLRPALVSVILSRDSRVHEHYIPL